MTSPPDIEIVKSRVERVVGAGTYHEHHHYGTGGEASYHGSLPEDITELADWINRTPQVDAIKTLFSANSKAGKDLRDAIFIIPARRVDYADLFVRRCAHQVLPMLLPDDGTAHQDLVDIEWPTGIIAPEEIWTELGKELQWHECQRPQDVEDKALTESATRYFALRLDSRICRDLPKDLLDRFVIKLTERLEQPHPARVFLFLYFVSSKGHGRGWINRLPFIGRCPALGMASRLRNTCNSLSSAEVLPPLSLVDFDDFDSWAKELAKHRAHQLNTEQLRADWTEVFSDAHERLPLAKIYRKLLALLEKSYRAASTMRD